MRRARDAVHGADLRRVAVRRERRRRRAQLHGRRRRQPRQGRTTGRSGTRRSPATSSRSTARVSGTSAVVAASSVDSAGNGSITLLSQNDTADGWRTLAVIALDASRASATRFRTAGCTIRAGRGDPHRQDDRPRLLDARRRRHRLRASGVSATSVHAPRRPPRSRRGTTARATGSSTAPVTSARSAPRDVRGDDRRCVAGELVTTISATPSGNGYWLFTNRGHARSRTATRVSTATCATSR